ncbi:MAG: GerW family sporulation protein [Clostridia bacterium]|nr:GerW family sporulation protein [Clostridia bacterium]MBR3908643.1 GerW family sporulation protein [Clostridia bacterium]MBR6564655.1 GerW family sporulation protein [Clostridia bacterium]MBR6741502.1 GerW family sporulation protein [Clostridia bacterium]
MSENSIKNIMDTTMEKLKGMIKADVITGEPVVVGDITLIPVSKVAYGLATGGSDFPTKNQSQLFGGGGGAGVTISPIAFIVINGDNVKMLPVYNELTTLEKAVTMAPEIIDKAKDLFKKDKEAITE